MSVNPAKTRVTFDLRPGPGAPRLPRNTVVDACGAEFVPWCPPAFKALIFARSCPPGVTRPFNAELGSSFLPSSPIINTCSTRLMRWCAPNVRYDLLANYAERLGSELGGRRAAPAAQHGWHKCHLCPHQRLACTGAGCSYVCPRAGSAQTIPSPHLAPAISLRSIPYPGSRRCGLLISARTLEVQADYGRYAGAHLASSMTMPPGMVGAPSALNNPKHHAL